MGGIECVSDLNRQFQQLLGSERFRLDTVLESLAFETFHHDEVPPILLPDLVNRADIRVIQRGSRAAPR